MHPRASTTIWSTTAERIANAIYLAFVLSGILGSVAKIVAYHRGFQQW
jgi:hypothetical protein